MAYSNNISRLSRLTAILLQLMSKTYVNVDKLSEHFEVSKRTIYRDLASLEEAGVPIIQLEGKGYGILKGYKLPPIMFSESEANALIFGEKLISKTKDESLIREFNNATAKIKSVLKDSEKAKAELLAHRTIIGKNWTDKRTSNFLSEIQKALTNYHVLKVEYKKEGASQSTKRELEPYVIYHNTSEDWVLVAWCRMRKDFRNFRVDRIIKMTNTLESFPPHKMTMEEYVEIQRKKYMKKS